MKPAATFLVVLALAAGGIAIAARRAPDRPAPPIVIVVFDALPGPMLMKPGGELDRERFPGFAQLAADATWYRNATTVHDSTIKSIPAILDGLWPSNAKQPTLADHPQNLFTLLRDRYRVAGSEQGTSLCPSELCGRRPRRLLDLLHGRRVRAFDAALGRLPDAADGKPPLWFAHVLLPHEPLRFLPGGRTYEDIDPEPGLDGNESFDNAFLTRQAEQRHLLQLRFTDRLLRRLLTRLKDVGLYRRALVVVTADHGMSFRVKQTTAEPYRQGEIGWRRDLTRANAQDVAFVPLFVKQPGQTRGRTDDAWVRTTDILPTLLDAAGVDPPGELAGTPLDEPHPQPASLPALTNRHGLVRLDPAAMLRRREATLARRARRFGVGGSAGRMFRIGPHPELIGRRARARAHGRDARAPDALRARFWGRRRFGAVDPGGGRVPSNVIGWLDGRAPWDRELAVAVNGRIAAVGRSFEPMGSTRMNFSLLVPPWAFRPGRNDVRLYEVRGRRIAREIGRAP